MTGGCIQGRSASRRSLHPGLGGLADPPGSGYKGGWADTPPRDTWDTTGYGQHAGGTHPTEMLSCWNCFMVMIQRDQFVTVMRMETPLFLIPLLLKM